MSVDFDPMRSMRRIQRGMDAGRELGCCSCQDTNCTIITTSMVAGGIIGGLSSGGAAIIPGVGVGFGVGLTIVAVKESIHRGECVLF